MSLKWDMPLIGNGEIQNYKIYYMEKGMDSEQVKPSSSSLCNIMYKSIMLFDNACEMFMVENRWSSVVCPEHKLRIRFIIANKF